MKIDKNKIKPGDLYLVDFESSRGHEFQGKRPALIIQSKKQILKSNLVTVMPLTSNLENKLFDDILIERDENNRLISDSVIKVFDIYSFDYSRFINKIGEVNQRIMDKVKNYLKVHFDF